MKDKKEKLETGDEIYLLESYGEYRRYVVFGTRGKDILLRDKAYKTIDSYKVMGDRDWWFVKSKKKHWWNKQ